MELVGRLKRRARVGHQRHVIDARLLVVERLGLPRSPGAADQRDEVAVRQEVDPLAVAAPRRAHAVVAIRGHRLDASGGRFPQEDARQRVGVGRGVGEEPAVGRPREVVEVAVAGKGQLGLLLRARRRTPRAAGPCRSARWTCRRARAGRPSASTAPSVVTCVDGPRPLAGTRQNSTSPDSSDSPSSDLPSGMNRPLR